MRTLDEAVFPSGIYCISCGALIDASRPYSLCDDCVRKIHWITGEPREDGSPGTCAKCGKALNEEYHGGSAGPAGRLCYDCMERNHYFTRGYSCMTYGLMEREIMMDFKYHEKSYLGRHLGDILFDRMRPEIDTGLQIDVIIPVPLSRDRMRKRGYNQTLMMARRMAERWEEYAKPGAPILEAGVLYRAKKTIMLRSLSPAERALALEGAFLVAEGTESRIIGKNVLLIDDIYTTGATADACSRALLEAGAKSVFMLSLASGGNRKPSGVR